MIQSSISLSLEVQPCIKNELTFRNRRHHKLVRKRGSKLTVKPGTKRQISLHRGTTWVTSMSPNAKLTLSPVSQVLYLNATRARFPAEIWAVQHLIYRRRGEFGIWRHRSHSCREYSQNRSTSAQNIFINNLNAILALGYRPVAMAIL